MTFLRAPTFLALLCLLSADVWAGTWGTEAQEEAGALAQVNLRRGQVGLPPVTLNSQLVTAARGHSNYLLLNNATGHDQVSGNAGFTGADPGARIRAAGYVDKAYGEVLAKGPYSGGAAIEGLIQAIYHRFAIFGSNFDEVGTGVRYGGNAGVVSVEFATSRYPQPVAPAGWVGTYPYDGQVAVTTDFFSDQEIPDPVQVPKLNRVGYPVSLQVDAKSTLTVSSFTLYPVDGAPLQAVLLAPGADEHTPKSAAALIPLSPLQYGTSYVAIFRGTVDGADLIRTWRFATAPYVPLAIVAPTKAYVGDTVSLAFVGGSGTYANLGWQYTATPANTSWIGDNGFSFRADSTGYVTFTLTDGDSRTATLTVDVLPASQKPSPPVIAVASGWNLLGNGVETAIDVAAALGNTTRVVTVWKWLPAVAKWAFYAPSMDAQALAAYAASKGYEVLTTVNPGEGFWINAKTSFDFQLSLGQQVVTSAFGPGAPHVLAQGWNLVAAGDAPTPATVNSAVGGVTTLWAWSNAAASWHFWAPTLASQGTLAAYVTSKGYLDFGSTLLGPLTGFWINKP